MVAFIGDVGGWELVLIVALVLVVFGPSRLPELARTVGKISAQIRAANRQLQREIYDSVEDDESRRLPAPAGRRVEHGPAPADGADSAPPAAPMKADEVSPPERRD